MLRFIIEPYRILRRIRIFIENAMGCLPAFRFFKGTKESETPITFSVWFYQKVLGFNGDAYWPMHRSSIVSYSRRVLLGVEVNPGYSPGCYIHAYNKIIIGDYTFIAPNVALMSANHDFHDLKVQKSADPIIIGSYCWLGMGCTILPEVKLGDFTYVGAGAVVTKSFQEGFCIVAGVPAKIIRKLDPAECKKFTVNNKFIGYVPSKDFEEFTRKNLDI